MLEVVWGMEELPENLERRDRPRSFHVWEHRRGLEEPPWLPAPEEQEEMGEDL